VVYAMLLSACSALGCLWLTRLGLTCSGIVALLCGAGLAHADDERSQPPALPVASVAPQLPDTSLSASPVAVPNAEPGLAKIKQQLADAELSPDGLHDVMFSVDQYRRDYPQDWRILPLLYRWAELSMMQMQRLFEDGQEAPLQQGLKQLWWLAPLQPGLAELQQRVDQRTDWADPVAQNTGKADVSNGGAAYDESVIHSRFRDTRKDNSPPLAVYPVDEQLLTSRDRTIEQQLEPVCREIVRQQASVILHLKERMDYPWLMVRLTLCVRRLDSDFRLRHSLRLTDGDPQLGLHPTRDFSLQPQYLPEPVKPSATVAGAD